MSPKQNNLPYPTRATRWLILTLFSFICFHPLAAETIDGGGTIDISGTPWTPLGDLFIAINSTATLNVTNGGSITQQSGADKAYLGFNTSGQGTANIAGAGSAWDAAVVYVGSSGTGTLNVNTGASLTTSVANIAREPGSTGAAVIDGAGSTWTNVNLFSIGAKGSGQLQITNGGSVISDSLGLVGQIAAADGLVLVDGSGSTWDIETPKIGFAGAGTLQVTNGGLVAANSGYAGELTGSIGSVSISGAGSTWSNDDTIYLAVQSTADLDVNSGGQVLSDTALVAQNLGSTATITVDGAGSAWTNTGSYYLGGSATHGGGNATLTLSGDAHAAVGGLMRIWDNAQINLQGGHFSVDRMQLDGSFDFTAGTLSFTGGVSQANNLGNHFAINDGQAKFIGANSIFSYAGTVRHITNDALRLEDNATIRVEQLGEYDLIGNGSLTTDPASGAVIENFGVFNKTAGDGETLISVPFVNSGTIRAKSGTMRFTGDLTQLAGQIIVDGGQIITTGAFDIQGGDVRGNGTITGNLTNFAGKIHTGAFPGSLILDGDYTQNAQAALAVTLRQSMIDDPEFVPENPDDPIPQIRILESDTFNVTGDATLDGNIEITLLDDYVPRPDDVFTIMTYQSYSGKLTPLKATAPGIDVFFDVTYSPDSIMLSPARFFLIASNLAPMIVPEPASLVLMAVSLQLLFFRRRNHR